MTHQGFGFCEFQTEEDADYACKIMNQIKLFGKPIRVNKVRSRQSALSPPKLTRVFMSRRPHLIASRLTLVPICLLVI